MEIIMAAEIIIQGPRPICGPPQRQFVRCEGEGCASGDHTIVPLLTTDEAHAAGWRTVDGHVYCPDCLR